MDCKLGSCQEIENRSCSDSFEDCGLNLDNFLCEESKCQKTECFNVTCQSENEVCMDGLCRNAQGLSCEFGAAKFKCPGNFKCFDGKCLTDSMAV